MSGGPELVIAMYRPSEGKQSEFLDLLATHEPTLRELELVTERSFVVGQCKDGTILEVFEWADPSASGRAHQHPTLASVWEKMATLANIRVTLAELPESGDTFPHFVPMHLG